MMVLQLAAFFFAGYLQYKAGFRNWFTIVLVAAVAWMMTPVLVHASLAQLSIYRSEIAGGLVIVGLLVLLSGYLEYRKQRDAVERWFPPQQTSGRTRRRLDRRRPGAED